MIINFVAWIIYRVILTRAHQMLKMYFNAPRIPAWDYAGWRMGFLYIAEWAAGVSACTGIQQQLIPLGEL